jgi:ABC-type glycerol-3-phosphate transport system substrate-binding protein
MKKLMFVLVIASLMLAGCGSKPAAEGPVEITFTMWGAPEELWSGRQC